MTEAEQQLYGSYQKPTNFYEALKVVRDERVANGYDWIVESTDLEMSNGLMKIAGPRGDVRTLKPTEWAYGQIAEKTGIRKEYFDKMLGELRAGKTPAIVDTNVNYWMHNYPKNYLVRQFRGEMIGLLSDKYRVIDNYDVANAVLATASKIAEEKHHQTRMMHAYITPKSMSFSVYDEQEVISLPSKPEDKYWLGIQVRNSEVGYTAFTVSPLLVRVVCTNGLIREDPFRKVHIGRQADAGDIWSNVTKMHEVNLTISQVADVTKYAFNHDNVQEYMNRLDGLNKIHIDPTEVKMSADLFALTEAESKEILGKLERNTAYEYVQAMTSYANDILKSDNNHERATELQAIAGKAVSNDEIWKKMEKKDSN